MVMCSDFILMVAFIVLISSVWYVCMFNECSSTKVPFIGSFLCSAYGNDLMCLFSSIVSLQLLLGYTLFVFRLWSSLLIFDSACLFTLRVLSGIINTLIGFIVYIFCSLFIDFFGDGCFPSFFIFIITISQKTSTIETKTFVFQYLLLCHLSHNLSYFTLGSGFFGEMVTFPSHYHNHYHSPEDFHY